MNGLRITSLTKARSALVLHWLWLESKSGRAVLGRTACPLATCGASAINVSDKGPLKADAEPAQLQPLLRPVPAGLMEAFAVSTLVIPGTTGRNVWSG